MLSTVGAKVILWSNQSSPRMLALSQQLPGEAKENNLEVQER